MAEWWNGPITSSEFITHSGPNGYEIHFRTPDRDKYLAVQDECRRQIGHVKPPTNADPIRTMSNEELAAFMERTDCPPHGNYICDYENKSCVQCWLDWLQSPAEGGGGG